MSNDEKVHGRIGSYGEIRRILAKSTSEVADEKEKRIQPSVAELIEGYEDEVNNGGIDQFFFNSTGDFALETVVALERIGAQKAAVILREACRRFPDGKPPTDLGARRQLMVSIVSPDSDAFDDLDEQFYKYEDDLGALLTKYGEEREL